MASAGLIVPLIGMAAGAYSIDASKKAAGVEAEVREDHLKRKQEDARNALRENTKRRLQEKKRRLARVRVQNAASGMANSGTQLAVFGEIESRLDEGIDEATSRSMGVISNYQSQIDNSKFQTSLNAKAAGTAQFANVIQGVGKGVTAYAGNYDRTGQDPFNIYK